MSRQFEADIIRNRAQVKYLMVVDGVDYWFTAESDEEANKHMTENDFMGAIKDVKGMRLYRLESIGTNRE